MKKITKIIITMNKNSNRITLINHKHNNNNSKKMIFPIYLKKEKPSVSLLKKADF